jgi:hypothetical protein
MAPFYQIGIHEMINENEFIAKINEEYSDEVAEFAMSGWTSMPWNLYRFALGYYLLSDRLPSHIEVEDAWRWVHLEFRRLTDTGCFA